jgi:hypothetical protein
LDKKEKQPGPENAVGTSGFSLQSLFKNHAHAVIALVIPLLMLTALRESAFDAENSVDSYYHVQIADMGPSVYLSKTFPWTTVSVWKEHFSDKELLYHIFLSGIRKYQKLINLPMTPPFNFPAVFFTGMMLAAFVFTANYFKVRNIIYYSLILIFISPFFTDRILMLRPHVLAITIMLLACPLIHSVKSYKDLGKVFIFAFFTSWAYSNPHFILLPVTAFALIKIRHRTYLAPAIIITAVAGLAAGLTVHPQFPNSFLIWKIQCFDVIMNIFTPSSYAVSAELARPSILWLICNSSAFIFTIYGFYIYRKTEKKSIPLSSPYTALGICAFLTTASVLFSMRAMEYALPFSLIFLGAVKFHHKSLSEHEKAEPVKNYSFLLKILVIALALFFMIYEGEVIRKRAVIAPLDSFSEFINSSEIPHQTVIANIVWSDFPLLFYSAPQFKYISGMEPMFSYAVNPEIITKLENFRSGKINIKPNELAELLNCRFAFISKRKNFYIRLIKLGYKPVYNGDDGVLFKLEQ